jgi:hypothetical protein
MRYEPELPFAELARLRHGSTDELASLGLLQQYRHEAAIRIYGVMSAAGGS